MENTMISISHHGTKGQKWGLRRWQYKNGSLTPAGRLRYLKSGKNKSDSSNPEPLSPKRMTSKELSDAIEHLRLEKTYRELMAEMNPQKESRVKKFIDDAIIPGVADASKKLVKEGLVKVGMKALGLEEAKVKDAYETLKKEADIAEAKQKISKAKRTLAENDEWFRNKNKEPDEPDDLDEEYEALKKESEKESLREKISKSKRSVAENDEWFKNRETSESKEEPKAETKPVTSKPKDEPKAEPSKPKEEPKDEPKAEPSKPKEEPKEETKPVTRPTTPTYYFPNRSQTTSQNRNRSDMFDSYISDVPDDVIELGKQGVELINKRKKKERWE